MGTYRVAQKTMFYACKKYFIYSIQISHMSFLFKLYSVEMFLVKKNNFLEAFIIFPSEPTFFFDIFNVLKPVLYG